MKAYSQDLRERVAAACAEPRAKIYQVAARFSVSLSFTNKLLRRQRTSGSVAALPPHPGPAPRLDVAGDAVLLGCLRAQPDATLAEIGRALAAAGGPALQRTAVWEAVERLGWGRKKKRPRRRTRHRTGDGVASPVFGRRSGRRFYPFCLR